jgi:glycosyltransferase involved in cell wall biosynthesis
MFAAIVREDGARSNPPGVTRDTFTISLPSSCCPSRAPGMEAIARRPHTSAAGRRNAAAAQLVERSHRTLRKRRRLPRHALCDIYASACALPFPSLAEGCGLAITEAMSPDVPVLTTWNTGADGLVAPGVDGLVVPAADREAPTDAMAWDLRDPVQLEDMRRRARERVTNRTSTHYRREFADIVREILSDDGGEAPETRP